jgi:hypothetical protein
VATLAAELKMAKKEVQQLTEDNKVNIKLWVTRILLYSRQIAAAKSFGCLFRVKPLIMQVHAPPKLLVTEMVGIGSPN